MSTIQRRHFIISTAGAIAAPAIVARVGCPAYAGGLFDGLANAIGGIGNAVAQGINGAAGIATGVVNTMTNTALQVLPAASQALLPVAPVAAMANQLASMSSLPIQLFGAFANSTPQSASIDLRTRRANRPYQMTSSDGDFYRADPSAFVRQNYERLTDFVGTYPTDYMFQNVGCGARQWGWTQPQQARNISKSGQYPAAMDLSSLNGITDLVRDLGPLISLIAAFA